MAKLKYAPGVVPIVNKHMGFTFLPNHYGHSVTSGQRNSRTRYKTQTQKMQNISRCIREWRNMSAATVLAWDNFATTYPQASRRNPAVFLTGYQLFLKRNHYVFLNDGIESEFMELPKMEALAIPDISFSIAQIKNCMDVTEPYIQNFGSIPAAGSFVILKAYPMAINSGQCFEPIIQTLEVLESYIDGLFLSLNYVAASPSIMFSVYLSKIIHQSVKYAGTKVKYMGCFKPSTFLELTDTPASYVGEAAKQVVVKADETGLEFAAPDGGGLTCADLPDCPTIQEIQEQISTVASKIFSFFPWILNTDIISGLTYLGLRNKPTVFQIGTDWYLISGENFGLFYGWIWNGVTWIPDAGIISGLTDVGAWSAPVVFQMGTDLYLIAGNYDGLFDGYIWNGVTWIPNAGIISGLTDTINASIPTVFQMGTSWYLISGKQDGLFDGYIWNGVTWVPNAGIISGLTDIGDRSSPTVFQMGAYWYLIAGEELGVFNGWIWNGSTWILNPDIISGLTDIGARSTPTVFQMGIDLFLISGEQDGVWNAWIR